MTSTLPFSYAGHILWNEVTYKNTSLDHENNCDYLEPDKSCFIVWSDPRLPEDSSYIIEAASSGVLHIAMLNQERVFCHKTLEERADEFGGKLDVDGEFDWGDPVGK